MAIEYSQLYKKDDDGNYMYEQQIKAFEAFAMTDVGKKYIEERAQEGFELKGVFEKDLSISVDKAGALDQKGVDVSFSVGVENNNADGTCGASVVDGRLKLDVRIADKSNDGTKEQVFNMAETIGHEVFYHGDFDEKKFFSLPASQRTTENMYDYDNHTHNLKMENTKYYKVGIGYLQQVQKNLGYSKINSRNYLYYNVMMPSIGYGYLLRPDIKE